MSFSSISCPQCGEKTIILWIKEDRAQCDNCFVKADCVSSPGGHKLVVSPILDKGEWIPDKGMEFSEIREFVEECFRPARAMKYKQCLIKTPLTLEGLIAYLELYLPPKLDQTDPPVAARVKQFDSEMTEVSSQMQILRKQLRLLRKVSRINSAKRTLEKLELRLSALAQKKVLYLNGPYDERATIRKRAIDRLKSDFQKFSSGLLELEDLRITHRVHWEILKPAGDSWEEILRHYTRLQQLTNRRYDVQRLRPLYDLTPNRIYVGKASFEGYVVFEYERGKTAVLECPELGNALYLMSSMDWKTLSQYSKTELLNRFLSKFTRITHQGYSWRGDIRRALRARGIS